MIKPLHVRHHAWSATFRYYGLSSDSAHAAFGGYKQSGIGRETHRMVLDHYQQTKNILQSYSPKKLGFL
ncbi:aldehyde dehydrogenase family protein [Streptomyces exfoliatus]|uniref:Aldehyde dehydrogenase family protein n=1 Tax=Streptomyces exfoliatus TaxID=1905 RepID=A0ABV3D3D1_STREX